MRARARVATRRQREPRRRRRIAYPAFGGHNFLLLLGVTSCTFAVYKLLVLGLFTLLADSHAVLVTGVAVASVGSTLAGAFLK